ncbi:glycoside hydrolase family 3 C-terminal domain-containing protein [Photobacterium sagamiensis]|uniref:beta-glucosidase n=1 Tax=Photobacterium sagamiensis TaxID=2910241 RepID=UPI003D0F233E
MFYEKIGASKKYYEEKATKILSEMTLEEKALLLTGNYRVLNNAYISSVLKKGNFYNPLPINTFGCDRLGVPPVGFSDGPRGVSMGFSTCFPVSMARGATFDRDIEKDVGQVIAKEVRAFEGGNYFAGICINLLRHPAWGRAQETYGEDPYHVGEFGLTLTEQVQDHGVMACVKHYAMNNIENSRFRVDIRVDDRSLHEIYLPHFKKCVVDGGAASLMGAYNLYNGHQVCESKELMTDVLRGMWGFEGFVSSDFFFGIRDAIKALNAGMDMEMPSPIFYHKNIVKYVNDGSLDISVVDESCHRVIRTTLAFTEKEDKQNYSTHLSACTDHTKVALRVAEESMTLIKNENNVLPLPQTVKKILVVGDFALTANLGDHGSSSLEPNYTVSPMQGIKSYFGDTVEIIHCGDKEIEKAKKYASEAEVVLIFAGCDHTDEGEFLVPDKGVDYEIISQGYRNLDMPKKAWLCNKLVMGGQKDITASDEEGKGVGGDRSRLGVRNSQAEMIRQIGRINPNTVVNIIAGSMIMTADWDDQAPAILYNWYSGMEGGNALAKILFGDVNPSGKMPFSTPYSEEHLPYFSTKDDVFTYDYYHGYYLLDKKNIKPMYPFGHGLSYTTFSQSNQSCEVFDDRIRVTVDVTNAGEVDGKEVVQVYVGYEGSTVERHKKELKGFEKVLVKAGETKNVSIDVMVKELEYFSPEKQEFVFEEMNYQLYVGNSSSEDALIKLDANLYPEKALSA